jgi:hypothetical protein
MTDRERARQSEPPRPIDRITEVREAAGYRLASSPPRVIQGVGPARSFGAINQQWLALQAAGAAAQSKESTSKAAENGVPTTRTTPFSQAVGAGKTTGPGGQAMAQRHPGESYDTQNLVEIVVPVSDLAAHCSPLDGMEWECEPIDPDEVMAALAEGRLEGESWQVMTGRSLPSWNDDIKHHKFHIERMAYLLANPDGSPIDIVLEGDFFKKVLRLLDGNHRLGAAILRNDETILVFVNPDDLVMVLSMLPAAYVAESEMPMPTR